MRTLGVVLNQAGKTNKIIEETHAAVQGLKVKWLCKEPRIELNAPIVTDISDLPVWPYASTDRSSTARLSLDIMYGWDGLFSRSAQATVSRLAAENNKEEWYTQWGGKYGDDEILQGLLATVMKTWKYNELPEPISPKTIWGVPYTMQLAIIPASGNQWVVVKNFIFEDNQKLKAIHDNFSCGATYGINWWSHDPYSTKKILQRIFENLGGFQVRYCQWPSAKTDGPVDIDGISAGYEFMRKKGPKSNKNGEFHEWVDTWTQKPGSEINGWPEGKCKSFLADCSNGCATARTIDFNFTTYKDMKPWFLDQVLKSKIASHTEHGIMWIGISESGKSLGSKTHGFQLSIHWINEEGRPDLVPSIATAKFIDMFRGERNTVFRPCTYDDGKFFKLGVEEIKAFMFPAEIDALLFARWGGSGFDLHCGRQAVSQQFDPKIAAAEANKGSISDEQFIRLIAPSFPQEADEEDWVAFRRRMHMIVLTEHGIFHRDATKEKVPVPRIDWDGTKDIFLPHVEDILKSFKSNKLKSVPLNYHDDVAWSQEYLKKAMNDVPMARNYTVISRDWGTNAVIHRLVSPMVVTRVSPAPAAVEAKSRDAASTPRQTATVATAAPSPQPVTATTPHVSEDYDPFGHGFGMQEDNQPGSSEDRLKHTEKHVGSFCGEGFEDRMEIQKIIWSAAREHHGSQIVVDSPPRKPSFCGEGDEDARQIQLILWNAAREAHGSLVEIKSPEHTKKRMKSDSFSALENSEEDPNQIVGSDQGHNQTAPSGNHVSPS